MSQSFVFRTIILDTQTLRTAVRPGSSHLPPLLICNGIGANLELVLPFVNALPADLEVIAFDVPGVGGSSTPLLPYRFGGLARLMARMLDYLNYGQVNVIGVSWGGALAQQFAHDFPERCKKLVLAATSAGASWCPANRRCCCAWPAHGATCSLPTARRSPRTSMAAPSAAIRSWRWSTPARSAPAASWVTTGNCSPAWAGPACPGCIASASRP